jgi:hypothetical protein
MTQRSSRVTSLSIAIIVVVFVTVSTSAARSKDSKAYCAGDSVRVRHLIDSLTHRWNLIVDSGWTIAEHLVRSELKTSMLRLALWHLYWQSHQSLSKALEQDSNFSADSLLKVLTPTWEQAHLLIAEFFEEGEAYDKTLEEAFLDTVASLAVCQAIQADDCQKCNWLEPVSKKYLSMCLDECFKVDMALHDRCQENLVELFARHHNVPPKVIGDLCEFIISKDPEKCESLPSLSNLDPKLCPALASNSKTYCQDDIYCLREVLLFRYIKKLSSIDSLADLSFNPVLKTGAEAARADSIDCRQLALATYAQASPSHFGLRFLLGFGLPLFE